MAAGEAIYYWAKEAKERQRAAGRFDGRNEDGTPRLQVVEAVPQSENGDLRDEYIRL